MNAVPQDIRYSLRMLLKNPGFTAVAVLTLALGIGANTTVFSLFKAVVFRPLPGVRNADELVVVASTLRSGREISVSYPDYRDIREQNDVFAGLAAAMSMPFALVEDGRSERVWGELVSGNYFEVLGVRPFLGRVFTLEDEREPGGHPLAVLSHGLWTRRFGGDPGIVGKTVRINGQSLTVVGVSAREFQGSTVGLRLDVFVPLMMQPRVVSSGNWLEQRGSQWLVLLGRLKPEARLAQAQASMEVLSHQLAAHDTDNQMGRRAVAISMRDSPFGAQGFLLPLVSVALVVAGLVLVLACVNVANLMLARAVTRQKEIAVRLSLGAGRRRLIRLLLTESLMLSLLGGAGAWLVTVWTTAFLAVPQFPTPIPIALNFRMDGLLLGFTLGVCVLSAVGFGLMPALQSTRVELARALREAGGRYHRSPLSSVLVIAEVAAAMALLVGAGLILRSQLNAARVNLGFDVGRVLTLFVDYGAGRHSQAQGRALGQQMLDRIRSLPGVEAASVSDQLPLNVVGSRSAGVRVDGYAPGRNEDMSFSYNVVSADYFSTLRIPIVTGREFGPQDQENSAPVIILNETLARRFWPGQNPLGRSVQLRGEAWHQVVGVARDAKYNSLSREHQPHFYLVQSQAYQPDVYLHVRSGMEPVALSRAVQREIRALDPDLPISEARPLREHLRPALAGYELATQLLGTGALLAVALAIVGVYGLVTYSVNQRMREIGIRMALGAGPRTILGSVVGGGMRLALAGVAIGLTAALGLTRFLSNLLLDVHPNDPTTFGVITVLLCGVAWVACWLPARRATKVDPMVALRYD